MSTLFEEEKKKSQIEATDLGKTLFTYFMEFLSFFFIQTVAI